MASVLFLKEDYLEKLANAHHRALTEAAELYNILGVELKTYPKVVVMVINKNEFDAHDQIQDLFIDFEKTTGKLVDQTKIRHVYVKSNEEAKASPFFELARFFLIEGDMLEAGCYPELKTVLPCQ